MNYYIVVDLGATKTRIALSNSEKILEKTVYSTPKKGDEYTIAKTIIEAIMNQWRDLIRDVRGIGIASIGPLDIHSGVVINTPNLEIKRIELLKPLAEYFRKPVYIANDAIAAAWGEKHYGDARGVENYVYITLSTGVGAGVIVDGELLIGKMGNAHEVGHIVINFDSNIKCGCGGVGHWEAYAGGNNLPKLLQYLVKTRRYDSELARLANSGNPVDAKTIFEYYRRKDPLALDIVDLYIKATAAGISSVINAYDPELITIGGSVFLNNVDILYEPILRLVRENIVTGLPEIKPTRLGDDVGLYGALALIVNPPVKLKKIQSRILESLGVEY